MIDENFVKNCKKLIKKLNQLEQADSLDEDIFYDMGLDLYEILSWSRYCVEQLLEEITWRNLSKSTINEVKTELKELTSKYPDDYETIDSGIRVIDALQWASKNSAKVHKKEKQELWKKAITQVLKESKNSVSLVMEGVNYIDIPTLTEICKNIKGTSK